MTLAEECRNVDRFIQRVHDEMINDMTGE